MTNMPDTDASKLDEWRWMKATGDYPLTFSELAEGFEEYRRLVREDVRPPAEADRLFAIADELVSEVYRVTGFCERDLVLRALRRGIELERDREAAMTELAALGQEFDAAEPDQDTLDTREVLAAFVGEEWAKHEDRDWHNAKAALIAIKDRVRHEEREAVCKWLSEQPDRIDAMKGKQFANYIARGEHRDTRP